MRSSTDLSEQQGDIAKLLCLLRHPRLKDEICGSPPPAGISTCFGTNSATLTRHCRVESSARAVTPQLARIELCQPHERSAAISRPVKPEPVSPEVAQMRCRTPDGNGSIAVAMRSGMRLSEDSSQGPLHRAACAFSRRSVLQTPVPGLTKGWTAVLPSACRKPCRSWLSSPRMSRRGRRRSFGFVPVAQPNNNLPNISCAGCSASVQRAVQPRAVQARGRSLRAASSVTC